MRIFLVGKEGAVPSKYDQETEVKTIRLFRGQAGVRLALGGDVRDLGPSGLVGSLRRRMARGSQTVPRSTADIGRLL